MLHARAAVCTIIALLCMPLGATGHAAAMLGADQGNGYSGLVLEKVAKTWQAPQYPSDHSVRVMVRIDGNGEVLDCTPVQSSNLALLDKSACAAVREIKQYPIPPYGMPIDVYLTFWTGLPSVSNLSPEPAKVASAAQATRNEQQAASSTAAALALARAAEARAAAANKGAANAKASPAQVSPGTSLSPRGTPPATPVTATPTAASGSAKGAAPKAVASKAVATKGNITKDNITKESAPKERVKSQSTKGGTSILSADNSDRASVLITKSPSQTTQAAPKETKASADNKAPAPSRPVASAPKGNNSAESREAAATAPAPSADSSTSGGRVVLPVPAKNARPVGNLVGTNAEEPTASEGRYARQVRWTIREAMLIPAELPVGEYTFTIYVRLSDTGEITKAEMTHSSDNPLMDKYAMRGIKRVKGLPPPPSQKLHDLHLTFVVQRS